MVDPTLLKIVSGEFKGLLADYLVLKAAIFRGGAYETTPEDWEAMYVLFKQSIELDPYFFMTGYYVQGLMAWREGFHTKSIDILKILAENRNWDWEPKFYIGFDYFYYLKDYESAAKYLKLSAERPGAPTLVSSLASRFAQKVGQTVTAIALLKTMIENSQDDQFKAYYTKRLEAYLAIYQLEQGVDAYRKIYGRPPQALTDLVDEGIINGLPQSASDYSFQYDPDTGAVSLLEVSLLKRSAPTN